MTEPMTPKRILIPGVLDSAAYDEKLRQFTDGAKPAAEPLSDKALGFADKIAADGDRIMRKAAAKVPTPTSPATDTSRATGFGYLTPDESQREAETRAVDALADEDRVAKKVRHRQLLRDMTDAEAAEKLGAPKDPLGVDPLLLDNQMTDMLRLSEQRSDTNKKIDAVNNPDMQPTQTWWLNATQTAARSAALMRLRIVGPLKMAGKGL